MKKFLYVVLMALPLCFPAGNLHAQKQVERRWEVDLTLGGQSMLPQLLDIHSKPSVSPSSLQEIYAPYFSGISSGTVFCVSAFVPVRARLELGLDSGFDRIIATRFDPVTDRETGELAVNSLSLLAGLRFLLLDDHRFSTIYTGLSAGGAYGFGKDTDVPFNKADFAGELVFGFRLGRAGGHWRLVGEMVAGSRLSGGRMGVGYRF